MRVPWTLGIVVLCGCSVPYAVGPDGLGEASVPRDATDAPEPVDTVGALDAAAGVDVAPDVTPDTSRPDVPTDAGCGCETGPATFGDPICCSGTCTTTWNSLSCGRCGNRCPPRTACYAAVVDGSVEPPACH